MSEDLATWRCQGAPRAEEILWGNLGFRVWERTGGPVWASAHCTCRVSIAEHESRNGTVVRPMPQMVSVVLPTPVRRPLPGHVGCLLGHGRLLHDPCDRGAGPADHEQLPEVRPVVYLQLFKSSLLRDCRLCAALSGHQQQTCLTYMQLPTLLPVQLPEQDPHRWCPGHRHAARSGPQGGLVRR